MNRPADTIRSLANLATSLSPGAMRSALEEVADKLDNEGCSPALLARWEALRPRVEALPANHELDQADLTEAISIARQMDQSGDPQYDEARAWFKANGLPTSYRPPVSA